MPDSRRFRLSSLVSAAGLVPAALIVMTSRASAAPTPTPTPTPSESDNPCDLIVGLAKDYLSLIHI